VQVGKFDGLHLEVLARACGARRAVEIGTLGGYSGVCLSRGMGATGLLHTFEREPRHAAVAQASFERAGVAGRVRIHVGNAAERLRDVEGEGPFDLVFVDADKQSYPAYYEALVPRLSPGGIMALDNTLWSGRVVEPPETPETEMFVELNARIAADPRVVAVMLTVRDGVTLVRRASG
jgi:caffeoyl-CoA O-methyltransferase